MKALRSFSVRPSIPADLQSLERLAMNLNWSWDERTRNLFRWVDPETWDDVHHDPVRLLGAVPRARLEALAADQSFLRYLAETEGRLDRYLGQPHWFQARAATSPLRLVAYFSPEFGISEAVPQYSGGLGVLAGDHLKSASDLGVPLVGIGLMYRNGYFRQSLSLDGWQEERFPSLDPHSMALTLCEGVKISVELAGETCWVQVWRADVGRTPLYLLDTDVEENAPSLRGVTDRLYGGDVEHRLRQEMILGVGGVRTLRALGIDAQVFHTNEGHAGFLGLERARELVLAGLDFDEALEAVRAGSIFTTHTPVPAGIDRFSRELMDKYFRGPVEQCGIPFERFFGLGLRADEPEETKFNMAVMGLRLAARSNGVAKLHGAVSREMFAGLWPDVPVDEVPITSITNGVHSHTWTSPDIDDLLSKYVLPDWPLATEDDWARIEEARDDELWRAKEQGRERLVSFVREHVRATKLAQGLSLSDTAWCDGLLDPKVLTVGFARRFATYKRATLLLSQPERLEALLLAPDKPVQFVFAGKAHPADDKGKALIQEIQRFASQMHLRHRFVFIDDYDMAVARAIVQGSDVWLNTPRRPQEASGTSGMKAALNGSLNCSILDGWWDEWFDGMNGWAISSAESRDDLAVRDEIEANSLFDLLEHQIVPMYYVRSEGPVPRRWMARVKHNFRSLGPKVTAQRMVRDYVTELYEPAAAAAERAAAGNLDGAKQLAAWKARVTGAWGEVGIASVSGDTVGTVALGATGAVSATVRLGDLDPSDVAVQLLHGPVGSNDEIVQPAVVELAFLGLGEDGSATYEGSYPCASAGQYGFTVRVVPSNPALASPMELGRVAWAG
jgi:glycogen phosphorylase